LSSSAWSDIASTFIDVDAFESLQVHRGDASGFLSRAFHLTGGARRTFLFWIWLTSADESSTIIGVDTKLLRSASVSSFETLVDILAREAGVDIWVGNALLTRLASGSSALVKWIVFSAARVSAVEVDTLLVRRALVSSAGAFVNVDTSGRVLLVRLSVGLSSSVETSLASAFESSLAVSWDTCSEWVAVMSTGSADSKRIVSSRAFVFTDFVDAGLSLNALVSSSFAFINVDASFRSVGTVSELSAVLSVSVSVVTGDAVAVVASLGV